MHKVILLLFILTSCSNNHKIFVKNLITETKQIPDIFSHLEILKKELDEIKSYKEDKF